MKQRRSSPGGIVLGSSVVFFALAFLLAAVREGNSRLYMLAAVVPAGLLLASTLLARVFALDRLTVTLVLSLAALGILAPAPADPDAALTHALRCAAGLGFLILGAVVLRSWRPSLPAAAASVVLSLLLLSLPLFSGITSLRTQEAALPVMLLSLVSLLTLRKQLIALLASLIFLGFFLAQREAALAMVWALTFLLLFWSSSVHPAVLLIGSAAAVLMGVGAVRLFPDILAASPGVYLLPPESASLWGNDLSSLALPAEDLLTEPLFNLAAAQYGLFFSAFMLLLIPVLALRGAALACAARRRFHALLVMGAVLITGLSAAFSLLSSFGVWKLRTIPLPFLCTDFIPLAVYFFCAGLLCGLSARNSEDLEEDVHLAMLAG